MSFPSQDNSHKTSFPWPSFWTALGILALFLCAVVLLVQWNPESPTEDALRAQERVKNLAQLRKENQETLSSYGWVDEAHDIAHIPIDEAMKLELPSLNEAKWQPHKAYPIANIDLVPHPAGTPQGTPSSTSKGEDDTTIPDTATE